MDEFNVIWVKTLHIELRNYLHVTFSVEHSQTVWHKTDSALMLLV